MKLLIIAAITLASASNAMADLSKSQDHLRNSPGRSSGGGCYDSNPNDLTNSQKHLRRSGGRQRPVYMSCQDAQFGTEFWWECRTVRPQ